MLFFLVFLCFPLLNLCNPVDDHEANLEPLWPTTALDHVSNGFFPLFWGAIIADSDSLSALSDKCQNSLRRTLIEAKRSKPWALAMIDASGKSQSGFVRGTIASLGDYDECIELTSETETDTSDNIRGNYCLVKIESKLQDPNKEIFGDLRQNSMQDENLILNRLARFPHAYGVCIPSSCTKQDLDRFIEKKTRETDWKLVNVSYCKSSDSEEFSFWNLSTSVKVSLTLLTTVVVVVVMATAIDLMLTVDKSRFVSTFSMRANFMNLVQRRPEDEKRFLAADRLRLIVITADIFLHSSMFTGVYQGCYLYNKIDSLLQIATRFLSQLTTTQSPHETIFTLGSLTASIAIIKCLEKQKPTFELIKRLFKWWSRVTIAMLFAFAIQIVLPLFGDGPIFDDAMPDQANKCTKTWLPAALMFHNFYYPMDLCLVHTWSIPTEFQCQLLLTLAVLLLLKSKRAGFCALLGLILIGMFVPAYATYKFNFKGMFLFPVEIRPITTDQIWHLRLNPLVHLSSYCLPFLCMYLRRQGLTPKISPETRVLGYWFLGSFTFLLCLWTVPWNLWDWELDQRLNIAYEAVHRPLFTMIFMWLVISSEDLGNILNVNSNKDENQNTRTIQNGKLEQHKYSLFVLILSRLAASTYLSHAFFMFFDQMQSRVLLSSAPYFVMQRAIVSIVGSHILGLLFYLFIEAPLTKIMDGRSKVTKTKLQ